MFGYRVPAPDEAMLISGGRRWRGGAPFRVVVGHGTFVFPLFRKARYLTLALPAAPAPDPASLALTRRVLTGLLGASLPAAWDDVTAALMGTGREPLTEQDRQALGPLAARFPLFA